MRGEFITESVGGITEPIAQSFDDAETKAVSYPEAIINFADMVAEEYGYDAACDVLDGFEQKGQAYFDELEVMNRALTRTVNEFSLSLWPQLSLV